MPKVSIVLPIYNNRAFLTECLESAASQTLSDIEIICVNDGSTDDSLDIMKSFAQADDRFVIIDKPNSGYGASMNVGCDRATGEYLTVLESDDVFPLDAVESMYNFAIENGGLDFLKADGEWFFGNGDDRVFDYCPATDNELLYESVFDSAADPGRYFARGGQPGMYKVSFLRENGIRYHESPGATFQDTSYWAQVMFCGRKVRYLKKSCYWIRRDNPGSSSLNKSKVYDVSHEYDFAHDCIDLLPVVDAQKCRQACAYYRFRNYIWNYQSISRDYVREFIQYFSREFNELDAAGELNRSHFTADELVMLDKIMTDPDAYYYEDLRIPWEIEPWMRDNEALLEALDRSYAEVAELAGSKRYKLGSLFAAPIELLRGDR